MRSAATRDTSLVVVPVAADALSADVMSLVRGQWRRGTRLAVATHVFRRALPVQVFLGDRAADADSVTSCVRPRPGVSTAVTLQLPEGGRTSGRL